MALSMVEDTTCVAYIRGKKGYILIEKPFHSPDSFIHNGVSCLVEVVAKTCVCAGKREEIKREGHGLHYETREVYHCILNGMTESEIVSWNDSLRWAQTFSRLADYDQK